MTFAPVTRSCLSNISVQHEIKKIGETYFGPEFAIDKRPGFVCLILKFSSEQKINWIPFPGEAYCIPENRSPNMDFPPVPFQLSE